MLQEREYIDRVGHVKLDSRSDRWHARGMPLVGTPHPSDWVRRVNRPETDAELDAVRRSVNRSAPFGSKAWQTRSAARLGLQSTLRPRGRPRKIKSK
jgi:hypothetical protein